MYYKKLNFARFVQFTFELNTFRKHKNFFLGPDFTQKTRRKPFEIPALNDKQNKQLVYTVFYYFLLSFLKRTQNNQMLIIVNNSSLNYF